MAYDMNTVAKRKRKFLIVGGIILFLFIVVMCSSSDEKEEASSTEASAVQKQTPSINQQLIDTAGNCNIDNVKALVAKGADINTRGDAGRTPIMFATYRCDTSFIKALIELGADLDAVDKHGNNLLHTSVMGKNKDTVNYFINMKKYDLKKKSGSGANLVGLAATFGNYEILKIVVDKGVDVNNADIFGITPLIRLAMSNINFLGDDDAKATKLLLKAGANPLATNKDGYDALTILYSNGREKTEMFNVLSSAMFN